jgi:phosphotransferase system HPr (HPr) family protein
MNIERKLTVKHKNGLHARPITSIVKTAQKFNCNLHLMSTVNNKKADCKSILSLLLLGATQGTELILYSSGPDAKLATDEISGFFERNFDEAI